MEKRIQVIRTDYKNIVCLYCTDSYEILIAKLMGVVPFVDSGWCCLSCFKLNNFYNCYTKFHVEFLDLS